jgi:hypothetical protein
MLVGNGLFQKCQQISAPKSALASPPNAKARQNASVRPSAERCLAHIQKLSGFADIEKLYCVAQLVSP